MMVCFFAVKCADKGREDKACKLYSKDNCMRVNTAEMQGIVRIVMLLEVKVSAYVSSYASGLLACRRLSYLWAVISN